MAVFSRIRNQFVHEQRHWNRLIRSSFNFSSNVYMEQAFGQRLRKAPANIFKIRSEFNFLEHLGLVKSLVSPGDGSDATENRDTLSASEARAIAEAEEWSKHNEAIPHEQILAEFGLSVTDWETLSREP